MITQLTLTGFRSLRNFKIELHQGLNVLIGPNGSGKSNIIAFFTFLSHLMAHSLPEAVSRLGGAGSFFQKSIDENFTDQVTATVWGSIRAPLSSTSVRGRARETTSLDYRYRFTVKASSDFSALSFIEESLFFRRRGHDDKISDRSASENDKDWDFILTKSVSSNGRATTTLVKWSNDHSPLFFEHIGRVQNPQDVSQRTSMVLQQVESMASLEHSLLGQASILFEPVSLVRQDLTGGEILNITPAVVKRTEDSASPLGVRSDGGGVAATLYRLKHPGAARNPMGPWMFEPRSSFDQAVPDKQRAFADIERYLATVNPSIERLSVTNDPFDNRIKVSVRIRTDKGLIDLPFTSMSDGTAKWLALVTAIVTSGSIFAIEEPENFIHPLMQREIVSIMRESTEHRDIPSLVLMTTHSETLLNVVRADEVIVIDMVNGFTQATRPPDVAALQQHIRETGFGLGHFYVTGALADA